MAIRSVKCSKPSYLRIYMFLLEQDLSSITGKRLIHSFKILPFFLEVYCVLGKTMFFAGEVFGQSSYIQLTLQVVELGEVFDQSEWILWHPHCLTKLFNDFTARISGTIEYG